MMMCAFRNVGGVVRMEAMRRRDDAMACVSGMCVAAAIKAVRVIGFEFSVGIGVWILIRCSIVVHLTGGFFRCSSGHYRV